MDLEKKEHELWLLARCWSQESEAVLKRDAAVDAGSFQA